MGLLSNETIKANEANRMSILAEGETKGFETPKSIFGFADGKYKFITSNDEEFVASKRIHIEYNADKPQWPEGRKLQILLVAGVLINSANERTECTLGEDTSGKTQQLSVNKVVYSTVKRNTAYDVTIKGGYVSVFKLETAGQTLPNAMSGADIKKAEKKAKLEAELAAM